MAATARKKIATSTPKFDSGMGGSRPGAGRKSAQEVASNEYQIYNRAKAKEKVYRAQLAELKAKLTSGELVEVAKVKTEWTAMIGNARARLLALPSKLAARGIGAASVGELQMLLEEGIREVLLELADDH